MEPKNTEYTATATLSLPASPAWYGTIRNLITHLCRNCGVDDRNAGSISLAIDEAVSNIHRHGYHGSHDEMIEIKITGYRATSSSPWKICICIEDLADQIELTKIKSREIDDIRPGGLGVHLIQSIMDTATWSHRDEGGMRLIMEKHGDNSHNSTDVKIERNLH
jgi:anti-sigma regulatory factor (Ser/Thr protein kinase)